MFTLTQTIKQNPSINSTVLLPPFDSASDIFDISFKEIKYSGVHYRIPFIFVFVCQIRKVKQFNAL